LLRARSGRRVAAKPYRLTSPVKNNVERLFQQRTSPRWGASAGTPAAPAGPLRGESTGIADRRPAGICNIGGGSRIEAYVNVDLVALPGVDVVANAEALPFRTATFQRVECDGVIEHVERPGLVMSQIVRVLAPGGFAHVIVPFCHPFHEYPRDFRRFTPDGLEQLAGPLQVVAEGWRSGPTATLLVFILEYVKLWLPWRPARAVAHGVLGWLLFPLRYLDLILLRTPRARQIGNHFYVWLRKSDQHCDG